MDEALSAAVSARYRRNMTGDAVWVTMVQNPDSVVVHGVDPQDLMRTLCGSIEVTPQNRIRGPFYGTEDRACSVCAARLPDNHF